MSFTPTVNAIYKGTLAACLGRDPDSKQCPELYTMNGIEGFAFQTIDLPQCIWYFVPDGYFDGDDEGEFDPEGDYTFRVHISHLHFYK
jgi:hypothetical protein